MLKLSSQPTKARVHIECGEIKADIEGTPDDVFREIVKLLNLETVSRLVYTVDIAKLLEDLDGILVIAAEGPILSFNLDLPADQTIGLCLLGSYVGEKIGKLAKNSLTVEELAKLTGKAVKTIRNELPFMIESGVIERVSRGEYRITTLGIKRLTETVIPKLKSAGGKVEKL
jgi:hypothetical protein